jgi:hypothetical protein
LSPGREAKTGLTIDSTTKSGGWGLQNSETI